MKAEREARQESKSRSNAVAKNLEMWEEMKKGTERGQKCCVRAKMDMGSDNGCMRDPTIYRCKNELHPATGDRYKVYPTYDFACPIVDSVEGVTHALRTTEYMDRDEQFNWFISALGLRRPHIYAYARLNLTNTVMSKRKLTHLVDNGFVDGWDDPRLPTVRGVIRRGLTVEALKQFIVAQGSSRSVVFMEWDKIWAMNKKVIDPVAPRFTAVDAGNHVKVAIFGADGNQPAVLESVKVDKHPKEKSVGEKTVWRGPTVLVDQADAEAMKVGENVTFVNWGNITIKDKLTATSAGGKVSGIKAQTNLENTDFKKTMKVTWLADVPEQLTPTVCIYFDHIISKPVLDKDDDFLKFVGRNTKHQVPMLGDPELKSLNKGDIIQLQRRGFFIVDSPYRPPSVHTCQPSPIRLIAIPDGTVDSYGLPGQQSSDGNQSKKAPALSLEAKKAEKKAAKSAAAPPPSAATALPNNNLAEKVETQGNLVRELKSSKAAKAAIDEAVKVLLDLKAKYKEATGTDWKPGCLPAAPAATSKTQSGSGGSEDQLGADIVSQGDKVRQLKADKAPKAEVDSAVASLLDLKAKYKAATGKDWKPGPAPPVTVAVGSGSGGEPKKASAASSTCSAEQLNSDIVEQGSKVRKLKSDKADKVAVDTAVNVLLGLKAKYKQITGHDWKPDTSSADAAAKTSKADKGHQSSDGTSKSSKKGPKADKVPTDKVAESSAAQKQTRLGMEAKKNENLPDWYSQVITKAELMEYYDISGCYILRPWAYSVWERMTNFFDQEIKKLGVSNCYFPMFVSQAALQREKEHIADFAPEVAWVTKSGETELAEPIAIRPTSETVMYPTFAKWIQSYRDLPLKLNQWNNVVVSFEETHQLAGEGSRI